MMDPDGFLYVATTIAFLALALAFLILVWRIVLGPTTADRILALDVMIAVAMGFIATFGVRSGHFVYIDIAIALGLVGFLSTVAFARFVLIRPAEGVEEPDAAAAQDGADGSR